MENFWKSPKRKTISQQKSNLEAQNMRNKKKKEEFEVLKKSCLELSLQVDELEESLWNLTLENEQLKLEIQKHKVHQTVFNNTLNLIQTLPHNSPYRRPLLFWFTKDITMEEAISSYGVSKRTYNRVLEQEDPEIVSRKYGIGVKREKITPEQRQEITRILDDILPVQSGRNYRYQETTDNQLYSTYQSEVIQGNPVSKVIFYLFSGVKGKGETFKSKEVLPIV